MPHFATHASQPSVANLTFDLYTLQEAQSSTSVVPECRADSPILGFNNDQAQVETDSTDTTLDSGVEPVSYPVTRQSSRSSTHSFSMQATAPTQRLDPMALSNTSNQHDPSHTPLKSMSPSRVYLDSSEEDDDSSLFYNNIPSRLPSRYASPRRRDSRRQSNLRIQSSRGEAQDDTPSLSESNSLTKPVRQRPTSVYSHDSSDGYSRAPQQVENPLERAPTTRTSSSSTSASSSTLLTPTSQFSASGDSSDHSYSRWPPSSHSSLIHHTHTPKASSLDPAHSFARDVEVVQHADVPPYLNSRWSVDSDNDDLGSPYLHHDERNKHIPTHITLKPAPTKGSKRKKMMAALPYRSRSPVVSQNGIDGPPSAALRNVSPSFYHVPPSRPSTAPTPTLPPNGSFAAHQTSYTDEWFDDAVIRDEKRSLRQRSSKASFAQMDSPSGAHHRRDNFKLSALKNLLFS